MPLTQLLAGANAAAVQNPAGAWEVFQFETATLVAAGTYNLTGLLRGQAGSEWAMAAAGGAGVPTGATVVLLTNAVARVDLNLGEVGLAYNWQVGPVNRSLGDASYVRATHPFAGQGLRPLAPVFVAGTRAANGDLTVSWVRRTRTGGDGWDAPDVPLGEETERYEVDVLNASGAVVRTLASVSPVTTYAADQQVADFGAGQGAVAVAVYQLSATVGRGVAGSAVV